MPEESGPPIRHCPYDGKQMRFYGSSQSMYGGVQHIYQCECNASAIYSDDGRLVHKARNKDGGITIYGVGPGDD